MEQVLYGDLDLFLIQMKKRFGKGTENGQKFLEDTYQEDYGMGFSIQIPKEFEQADAQSAAAVFWSEKRPPVILITPKREEGLTFQFLSEEMAGAGCWIRKSILGPFRTVQLHMRIFSDRLLRDIRTQK